MANGGGEQYDLELNARVEDALDQISKLNAEINRLRAELNAVSKETGASENIDRISVAFETAEKEAADFQKQVDSGSSLAQRGAFQLAKAIQDVKNEIEAAKVSGKDWTADQVRGVEDLEKKLTALLPKAAAAREQQERLRREIELSGKSHKDFARDLGLPIDRLALYALGVAAVKDTINVLREQAVQPLAREFGLTAEQTGVLETGLNNVELILRGKVATAFLAAKDAAASFFVEMVQGEASLAAVENKVAARVLAITEARRQQVEQGNAESEALTKLILMEKERGQVEEDTIERTKRLVDQLGNKLSPAFLALAQSIGVTIPPSQEVADHLERAFASMEAGIARTEKLSRAFSMTERDLNGLTEDLEVSISLLKMQGEVSEQEAEKVKAALRKQIDAYREAGMEIPEHLSRIAEEWGVVEEAQDKAGKSARKFADDIRDSTRVLEERDKEIVEGVELLREEGAITEEVSARIREELEKQLDAYKLIGQEAPPEIKSLAEEFKALDAAQDRVLAGAKALVEQYEGNEEAINEQTEALRLAIKKVEEDGFVHHEVAEEILKDIERVIRLYHRMGQEAPDDILRTADTYRVLLGRTTSLTVSTDKLGESIHEAFSPKILDDFLEGLEEVQNQVDEFFDEVQDQIDETFSPENFALPDDNTGGQGKSKAAPSSVTNGAVRPDGDGDVISSLLEQGWRVPSTVVVRAESGEKGADIGVNGQVIRVCPPGYQLVTIGARHAGGVGDMMICKPIPGYHLGGNAGAGSGRNRRTPSSYPPDFFSANPPPAPPQANAYRGMPVVDSEAARIFREAVNGFGSAVKLLTQGSGYGLRNSGGSL